MEPSVIEEPSRRLHSLLKYHHPRQKIRSIIWMLIGLGLIAFAVSIANSIDQSPNVEVFYVYGTAILTLMIVLGVLFILLSFWRLFKL